MSAEHKELNTKAINMLNKLTSSEIIDYYIQLPILVDKTHTIYNINEKINALHHLSMYYLTSDQFTLAESSLNDLFELSEKHQNKVMQAIAEVYLVVVKARYKKDQIRTQLEELAIPSSLKEQRKFEINYLLAYSFAIKTNADYAQLEKLALQATRLAKEPSLTQEYFIALWRLANNELNMPRRLSAIEQLVDLSIEKQLPLNRHILLYNLVNYLIEQQGNIPLSATVAEAYLSLATELNNETEIFLH